ncbi:hypothetical protein [Rhizobium tubonense]|uniref:Adenylyl cyclase n=1 Tax=Rhizobium tubonense TaxID=484088 RepID=A0A2W4EYN3_9HYPH|nr:hypothetical protein [Rhizobium tubonense]PZM15403.1 hypothetical protein CPY51_07325 [Rhizobium tubonense]
MRLPRSKVVIVAGLLLLGLFVPMAVRDATCAEAGPPADLSAISATQRLGANVIVLSPKMPLSQIQSTVDAVAARQLTNQFGPERYSLLFQPGTYGTAASPLVFQVGYYTQVAGLGKEPGDVVINGSVDVYNQCDASQNCLALNNFWRSLSNLTIKVAGGTNCHANTEFWAVSQAAPMRRVAVDGAFSLMDYCSKPAFASGGFIADTKFTGGSVVNGSQQQFLVRNSDLDGWSNGVWNQVFSGTVGAPAQSFGVAGANPYTTLDTTAVSADAPYLYTDAADLYRVMVPAVQHGSRGTSWAGGSTAGTSMPITDFFVANPKTPVAAINRALALHKDLILTPGVYPLAAPIIVSRPDTIILGMGFARLNPQQGSAAMVVLDVPGTKLSGVMFDAGPKNSPVLLQVGTHPGFPRHGMDSDPTQIQDVFFRIGGAGAGRATTSLIVNSSHVLLDNIWAWRADHGTGVGWTANTADHGVIVNGDDVSAYGLFVEHYQKTEVTWNGQGGSTVFFQNEMPYDPPTQAAWSLSATFNGYPAFVVSPNVRTFQGYGMGSYSYFNHGLPIKAATAFQVPQTPGVRMHDLLTVFLDGSGSVDSVINGTGAAVAKPQQSVPSQVVSYP